MPRSNEPKTSSVHKLFEFWKIAEFLLILVVISSLMYGVYYSPFDRPIIVLLMIWLLLFPVMFGLFYFRILQPETRQSAVAICGSVMFVMVAILWLYR